ncbi:MAG: hypothetical protein QNJ22_23125 [Desulfosarcinaceae bacterium]|nr:hypothetical protein [Desulfosarcinaceae bacterium]
MTDRHFHHHVIRKRALLAALIVFLFLGSISSAAARVFHLEKRIQQIVAAKSFDTFLEDRRCPDDRKYRVYIIDNFKQGVDLVPEVLTSHGEILVKILKTGRDDIELVIMDTALSKGLKRVLRDLIEGDCVDAVVSSVPGSNYTYGQISTLLPGRPALDSDNILYYRNALRHLLSSIAFGGFPSVEWLQNIDVNSAKLRNDALKFIYIEALGRFNVPVILPYGNSDTTYKGQIKAVNLLSVSSNARVYSALDQAGDRVAGFPYSPLSYGEERAVYSMVECPHPDDPFKAVLDINNDGNSDYTYQRSTQIAYYDDHGMLAFAPPVLDPHQFTQWRAQLEARPERRLNDEVVLTAAQYAEIERLYPPATKTGTTKSYVWLNASEQRPVYAFDPACWKRGTLIGTSVIPPNKIREMLPPKTSLISRDGFDRVLGAVDH